MLECGAGRPVAPWPTQRAIMRHLRQDSRGAYGKYETICVCIQNAADIWSDMTPNKEDNRERM